MKYMQCQASLCVLGFRCCSAPPHLSETYSCMLTEVWQISAEVCRDVESQVCRIEVVGKRGCAGEAPVVQRPCIKLGHTASRATLLPSRPPVVALPATLHCTAHPQAHTQAPPPSCDHQRGKRHGTRVVDEVMRRRRHCGFLQGEPDVILTSFLPEAPAQPARTCQHPGFQVQVGYRVRGPAPVCVNISVHLRPAVEDLHQVAVLGPEGARTHQHGARNVADTCSSQSLSGRVHMAGGKHTAETGNMSSADAVSETRRRKLERRVSGCVRLCQGVPVLPVH